MDTLKKRLCQQAPEMWNTMPLVYKEDVLTVLKDHGYNTTRLRKDRLLSESAIQALREKKPISWANIEKLCHLLECQPDRFLEYCADDNEHQAL